MKKAIFFLFLTLTSCQLFENKEPDQDALLRKELEKINWEIVDQYPLPDSCNELLNFNEQQLCLLDYLYSNLNYKMQNDSLSSWPSEIDTLSFEITIDSNALVSFKTQFIPSLNDSVLNVSNVILEQKLKNFPKIQPAIKQGIKVKTIVKKPILIPIKKAKE